MDHTNRQTHSLSTGAPSGYCLPFPEIMWEQHAREEAVFRGNRSCQNAVQWHWTLQNLGKLAERRPRLLFPSCELSSYLSLWSSEQPVLAVQGLLIVFYTLFPILQFLPVIIWAWAALFQELLILDCIPTCVCSVATASAAFWRGTEQVIWAGTVSSSRILKLR